MKLPSSFGFDCPSVDPSSCGQHMHRGAEAAASSSICFVATHRAIPKMNRRDPDCAAAGEKARAEAGKEENGSEDERPRKPPGAFRLFWGDLRENTNEMRGKTCAARAVYASGEFHALTSTERSVYEVRAARSVAEWGVAVKTWEQRQRASKPKRPMLGAKGLAGGAAKYDALPKDQQDCLQRRWDGLMTEYHTAMATWQIAQTSEEQRQCALKPRRPMLGAKGLAGGAFKYDALPKDQQDSLRRRWEGLMTEYHFAMATWQIAQTSVCSARRGRKRTVVNNA
jgi:hypothetical protein